MNSGLSNDETLLPFVSLCGVGHGMFPNCASGSRSGPVPSPGARCDCVRGLRQPQSSASGRGGVRASAEGAWRRQPAREPQHHPAAPQAAAATAGPRAGLKVICRGQSDEAAPLADGCASYSPRCSPPQRVPIMPIDTSEAPLFRFAAPVHPRHPCGGC